MKTEKKEKIGSRTLNSSHRSLSSSTTEWLESDADIHLFSISEFHFTQKQYVSVSEIFKWFVVVVLAVILSGSVSNDEIVNSC